MQVIDNPVCVCNHTQWIHGDLGCRGVESRGPMRDNNDYDDPCACKRSADDVLAAAVARDIAWHKCAEHRRYQAKRKPRVACEGCWRLYLRVNP